MSTTELYRDHLQHLDRSLTQALAQAAERGLPLDGALFHAGPARYYHRDDQEIRFVSAFHFARWVPVQGPEHLVLARPGQRPKLVRVRPRDYWYDTSPPPVSYWESEVDLEEVESFEQAVRCLGKLERVAFVGEAAQAAQAAGLGAELVEPTPLMDALDWARSTKTTYEVALIEEAVRKSAAGHLRARDRFLAGGSEREVHWAYLEGSGQLERELPFDDIVAFDEKAAILHYQHKRGSETGPGRLLLLDAGASSHGYASDLTRTWPGEGCDGRFAALVSAVDHLERDLVAMITPGRPYLDVHVAAHQRVGAALAEVGVLKVSGEEAFDRGLTHPFLPHGVGHHMGLQVHDVAGHQAGPGGGTVPPPEEYPFLRNTRVLEPGHVVTVEPGIYFIPMLLAPLRQGPHASVVDWDLVDQLTPFGGIRIEDDVLCTEGEPRDLSRPHLPGPSQLQ